MLYWPLSALLRVAGMVTAVGGAYYLLPGVMMGGAMLLIAGQWLEGHWATLRHEREGVDMREADKRGWV